MTERQSVLIIEPHCSGHRMAYVREITSALRDSVDVHIVTSDDCLVHPYCAALIESGVDVRTAQVPIPKLTFGLRRQRAYLHAFERIASDNTADLVMIPYLDYVSGALALRRRPFNGVPFAGIIMRPAYNTDMRWSQRLKQAGRRVLFQRLLRAPGCRTVFCIDDEFVERVRHRNWRISSKVAYLPDPVMDFGDRPSREDARNSLGIAQGAFSLLVFGNISERKGLDSLLNATARMPDDSPVFIHIAGQVSAGANAMLQAHFKQHPGARRRFRIDDSFLTDDEVSHAFSAADAVWACYREHPGMSGVLVQAAAFDLPVIACSTGCIGSLARRFKLGPVTDVDDVAEIADALVQLQVNGWPDRTGITRFAETHSRQRFRAVIGAEVGIAHLPSS